MQIQTWNEVQKEAVNFVIQQEKNLEQHGNEYSANAH